MKAVYLNEVESFVEVEHEYPKCKKGQVIVKIGAVGICGSDVHYWKNGRIGNFVVEKPMILGHECSGEIVEVGEGVDKFSIGERVVMEPGIPCLKCNYCLEGRYNLCPDINFFATPPYDGCLVEYLAYDEKFVFPIPDEIIDNGLATMVEPISVGVFATQRIKPQLGERAVVFGAGIIGIACLLSAKAAGCQDITVIDVRDDRLDWAMRMGATKVINSLNEEVAENVYDIGYEATGAEACYKLAAKCIKAGGRVSLLGMGAEMQLVPMVEYVCKEIAIVPSFRYANTYPLALDILTQYKDILPQLITHRVDYSLEGVEEAFVIASSNKEAVKVVVEFK